jgi:hypothetical protein
MGVPIALSTIADEASFELSSLIIGILKVCKFFNIIEKTRSNWWQGLLGLLGCFFSDLLD